MSEKVDEQQWSKINELKDEFHTHEKECAEWRGQTGERLNNMERSLANIERALKEQKERRYSLWVVMLGAVLSGSAVALLQYITG